MIKHIFVSTAEDDGNPDHVQGSHWNQDHSISDPDAVKATLGLAAVATSGSATDLTGTLPGSSLPSLTGDVTSSGTTTTISSGVVSDSKLANMPASTIKGNNTLSSTSPINLSTTQVKTLLAISTTDISGLSAVATSGSASDLSSGTLPSARLPAHTGDVTSSAGSAALTIANDSVTNAKLANMAANSIKGNNTGISADPLDLTSSQVKSLLAITSSDISGLASIATSGSAADLTTGTIPSARMPALTGDVTTSSGSVATTIASGVVSNSKLANMPSFTVKGNNTGGSTTPLDLTTSDLLTMLNIGIGGFGPATDGTVTFDGSTSVAGFTGPTSNVYTASRETYFQNATVNSGITLNLHGYPINVRGTLTNNGHISYDGISATGQTGGAASSSTGPLPLGTLAGNGGNANTNGGNGGSTTSGPRGFSATAAAGGTGGTPPTIGTSGGTGHGGGGGASLANGGTGGVIAIASASNGDWQSREVATTGILTGGGSIVKLSVATGGGGGAGGGGSGVGGGGGSGGSWGVLRVFKFSGSGTITAIGGNGAAAAAASGTNQPGGGGGGGGGGGVLVVVTADQAPPITSASQSTVCAGGSGGSGGAGTGTGSAGSNGGSGGSGLVLVFN